MAKEQSARKPLGIQKFKEALKSLLTNSRIETLEAQCDYLQAQLDTSRLRICGLEKMLVRHLELEEEVKELKAFLKPQGLGDK